MRQTGTTAVGAFFTQDGAIVNGAVVRYANHLNTLNNRPVLNIAVRAGSLLGATNI